MYVLEDTFYPLSLGSPEAPLVFSKIYVYIVLSLAHLNNEPEFIHIYIYIFRLSLGFFAILLYRFVLYIFYFVLGLYLF